MDALIKQVSERAGISEDQARKAVDVIVDQLKSKLPGPMASQVEGLLGGDGGAGGGAGDLGSVGKKLGF